MKKILFSSLALLAFACHAATPSFQDFDGSQFGTNGNKVRIKSGATMSNLTVNGGSIHASTALSVPVILPSINPGGYYRFLLKIDNSTNLYSTTLVSINTTNGNLKLFLPANTPLLGINALGEVVPATNLGLTEVTINNFNVTNIANFNIINVTNTATFNGKVNLTSNVYLLNLIWKTNLASTTTLQVGHSLQRLSTNNNVNVTGYTGMDGTNGNTFSLIWTNTAGSAAVKTMDLPAGTIVLSAPNYGVTRTIYNTNQGVLSGIVDPLFGTNVTWTGF